MNAAVYFMCAMHHPQGSVLIKLSSVSLVLLTGGAYGEAVTCSALLGRSRFED